MAMTVVAKPVADAAAQPADSMGAGYKPAYLVYAIALMALGYTLGYADRSIVAIVAQDIKDELGLKDWQIGALAGTAFAIPYTLFMLPVARLAEYFRRPLIIGATITVWSLFTAGTAFTSSFAQLLLMRLGVGLGEAGNVPACHSLISAYVSKRRRALALGVFSTGIRIGALLGLAVGGLVADAYGWRSAFLALGIPGVIIGVLVALTLREPRRRSAVTPPPPPPFKDSFRLLFSKRSFIFVTAAGVMISLTGNAIIAFNASFFLREHKDGLQALADVLNAQFGLSLGPLGLIGLVSGVVAGLAGVAATIFGGWLTDYFGTRDKRAYMAIPAIATGLAIPFELARLLVPDTATALSLGIVGGMLQATAFAGLFTTVMSLSPANLRTTASAIFNLIGNGVGLVCGPVLIGLLSDAFGTSTSSGDGLRRALMVFDCLTLITATLFWLARRDLAREFES
jgi:MFS family permease